jgi:exodeoxyribonuclease VII small subunit
METGELPLQESLAVYKRGAALLAYCQSALKDAQQQVQVMEKGLLQPFAADDVDDA